MSPIAWLLLLLIVVGLSLFVGYFVQKLATARKLAMPRPRPANPR